MGELFRSAEQRNEVVEIVERIMRPRAVLSGRRESVAPSG
jgi:hypothetical protein